MKTHLINREEALTLLQAGAKPSARKMRDVTIFFCGQTLRIGLADPTLGLPEVSSPAEEAEVAWDQSELILASGARVAFQAVWARSARSLTEALSLPASGSVEGGGIPAEAYLPAEEAALPAWAALQQSSLHRPTRLTRVGPWVKVINPPSLWLQEEAEGAGLLVPSGARDLIPYGRSTPRWEDLLAWLGAPPSGMMRAWAATGGFDLVPAPAPSNDLTASDVTLGRGAALIPVGEGPNPARDVINLTWEPAPGTAPADVLELSSSQPLRDFLALAEDALLEGLEVASADGRLFVRARSPRDKPLLEGWAGKRWVNLRGHEKILAPSDRAIHPALRRDQYERVLKAGALPKGDLAFADGAGGRFSHLPKSAWKSLRSCAKHTLPWAEAGWSEARTDMFSLSSSEEGMPEQD